MRYFAMCQWFVQCSARKQYILGDVGSCAHEMTKSLCSVRDSAGLERGQLEGTGVIIISTLGSRTLSRLSLCLCLLVRYVLHRLSLSLSLLSLQYSAVPRRQQYSY